MGKKISAQMTYDADPTAVYAMYADPEFVREKNERTGGRNVAVEVDARGEGCVIVASRELPADQLPSIAKKFVGDTIATTQTDTWQAPNSGNDRDGTMSVDFHSLPMSVSGTFRLEATKNGTVCKIEAEVKASVPFVSGKLEDVTAGQFMRAVGAEEKIGREWLAN